MSLEMCVENVDNLIILGIDREETANCKGKNYVECSYHIDIKDYVCGGGSGLSFPTEDLKKLADCFRKILSGEADGFNFKSGAGYEFLVDSPILKIKVEKTGDTYNYILALLDELEGDSWFEVEMKNISREKLMKYANIAFSWEKLFPVLPEDEVKKGIMYIMMGIQGSGKSTFCEKNLQYLHKISLDELHTRSKEMQEIMEVFEHGCDFVIDNTNPTSKDRERYISLAKENNYRVVGIFMESKLQKCIERNNKREGKACVPAKAIASTQNKLEIPRYDEGFDQLLYVRNDDKDMIIEEWEE